MELPPKTFLFDIHLVCGGYAYFSTFSGFVAFKHDAHRRDVRSPVVVKTQAAVDLLSRLQINPLFVQDSNDYLLWQFRQGWALIDPGYAKDEMSGWMTPRPCIIDSLGSFTDVNIASPRARGDRTNVSRPIVLKRSGTKCVLCGKWSEFDKDITMHHVTAFSHGGETTSRNLVPLCQECNQSVGTERVNRLYDSCGIPHSFDLRLLTPESTAEILAESGELTKNLMHSRCELP